MATSPLPGSPTPHPDERIVEELANPLPRKVERRRHGGETLPAVTVQTVMARQDQALTLVLRGVQARREEQLGEGPGLFVELLHQL